MVTKFVKPSVDMDMPPSGSLSPIARQYLSGLTSPQRPLTLPGCTANDMEEKPISISNEMLQAYVMMRGPGQGFGTDPDDPLLDWVLLRDEIEMREGKKLGGGKKDIRRLLSNVNRVLHSEQSPKSSPQTNVFELHRPDVKHIHPPQGMDLSMHMLNACCDDFEFEEDGTDDEEHVPRGRISPCTFLAWSKGCKAWEEVGSRRQRQESMANTMTSRRRPQSPELYSTPPSTLRRDRWPTWNRHQDCMESGTPLSPYYQVPSSPSMLWNAEGIDGDRMEWKPQFEDYYRRMDYKAAKKLQQLKQYGNVDSETMSPMSNDVFFAQLSPSAPQAQNHRQRNMKSEIDGIVADDIKELDPNADISAARNVICDQRVRLEAAKAEHDQIYRTIDEQAQRIRDLELEKQIVTLAVWNVQNKREVEGEQRRWKLIHETPEEKKLRQQVLGHFRHHIKDIDYKNTMTNAKIEHDRKKKDSNDQVIRKLEKDILQACGGVGKSHPEEVYDELREGGEYRPIDPRTIFHHGFQFGSAYTDIAAQRSPLRAPKDGEQRQMGEQQEQSQGVELQGDIPQGMQYPAQFSSLFYPHIGLGPYDLYGVHGSDNHFDIEAHQTSIHDPEASDSKSDSDKGSELMDTEDVYDAQGFPISPSLNVMSVSHQTATCADTPSRASMEPIANFPWTMPSAAPFND
ncbi:hypothetical protein BKA67DRAFT_642969 [Truncatella angustata]|uniref:Uncharacterized protein n=1 Tax=Truncatella angustata TaxID=152316 RepID=A0A9P8URH4_9PEZI|nr:uncharacterized protein BKA67DRAFT_642969 [Truncatella angustata]KAH6656889.1 hypothetical protein BKA67DRAFT_642969 [Truncatella angustata]